MSDKYQQSERAWMTLYLSSCGMSEFDRVNARAMLVRGITIGDLLARCWQRIRGA